MSDIKEKISAFYDGELNLSSKEIDELIIFINENPSLSEQISMMALTSAMNESQDSNLTSINAKKKDSNISYKNDEGYSTGLHYRQKTAEDDPYLDVDYRRVGKEYENDREVKIFPVQLKDEAVNLFREYLKKTII